MTDPNFLAPEWETPPEMQVKGVRLAHAAGARELGMTLYEVPPGAAISPYHVHHANEELLIVLSGRPLVRTPDGTRRLEPGAVVSFPRGPEGAHRVANPGDGEPARVLLVSTMNLPEIAEHVTTGTVLTMTAAGEGHAWPSGGDAPFMEQYAAAMELDAAEDQRGLSTS